jgi:pimeloyl-ACP methyl ester carboxylesterase
MRVWRRGRGPVVLAVHGLGGSGRYWRGLADRIGDRRTIVAPDLPGFGASDRPDRDVDRPMLLDDLDAIVEHAVGGEQVHVVGHSLGGVLAALWAGAHGADVSSLALVSAPFPDPDGMDPRSRADLRPTPGRRAAARITRAIWPALAVPIGLTRGYPPDVVVDFGRQSVRARAWTMWSLWSDPTLGHEVTRLAALDGTTPTLLVHASDDRTVSPRAQAAWAQVMPRAERRMLAEGGHQLLLRTGFEPIVAWLARDAAGG